MPGVALMEAETSPASESVAHSKKSQKWRDSALIDDAATPYVTALG
jgi:hypothetical protein